MKKIIILLFIVCSMFSESFGCVNYYYTVDSKGELHEADELQRGFNTNFNLKLIEQKLKKLEKQLESAQDYKVLSDYAVLLMKGGKTKTALEILSALAKQHPNEYQIIANLGTAYEVNGEVQEALKYIKKGIVLNPDSHNGSEWVHVKILETKLKLAKNKNYLANKTILELTEKDKKNPAIRDQISLQVRERFPFSAPPNPIMANLLIDLGDCYANTSSIEFAKTLYTIAKAYYGAEAVLVDEKIKKMIVLRGKYAAVQPKEGKEVDHIKLEGIPYKSMLDNNNHVNHKIKWETITTDVDDLLSLVNIDGSTTSQTEEIKKEKALPTKNSNKNIYLLLLVVVIGFGWLIYKRQQKN